MTFLTVITRHLPTRRTWLVRNQESLRSQTDRDYEQIVLTDERISGFDYANHMVAEAANQVCGAYVLLLDDDDVMDRTDGIALMRGAVRTDGDPPPAVIFRGDHGDLGILPRASGDHGWRSRPRLGNIGSFDFIIRADLFRWYMSVFRRGGYASDWALIHALWVAHGSGIVWLDEVICRAPQRSAGAPEPAAL